MGACKASTEYSRRCRYLAAVDRRRSRTYCRLYQICRLPYWHVFCQKWQCRTTFSAVPVPDDGALFPPAPRPKLRSFDSCMYYLFIKRLPREKFNPGLNETPNCETLPQTTNLDGYLRAALQAWTLPTTALRAWSFPQTTNPN